MARPKGRPSQAEQIATLQAAVEAQAESTDKALSLMERLLKGGGTTDDEEEEKPRRGRNAPAARGRKTAGRKRNDGPTANFFEVKPNAKRKGSDEIYFYGGEEDSETCRPSEKAASFMKAHQWRVSQYGGGEKRWFGRGTHTDDICTLLEEEGLKEITE